MPGQTREELSRREHPAITLFVDHVTPDGEKLSFFVDMDPAAAVGRQGCEGDFRGAVAGMKPERRVDAALYQLTTLPYSNKQSGSATADRLRFAIEEAGGVLEALPYLDERFALHADKDLRDETFKIAGSGPRERTEHYIRVAGNLVADPACVDDRDFEMMVNYFANDGLRQENGHKFVDSAFERMGDNELQRVLYQGFTDDSHRAAYLTLITDPVRLSRITTWYDPQRMTAEGVNSPGHKVEFLSRVARSVSAQLKNDAVAAAALGAETTVR